MKRLTEKNSGQEIKLGLEEELIITLQENPSTGFIWQWKEESRFISLIRSQIRAPQARRLGGGGERDFIFVTRYPGRFSLNLLYLRPWQKDKPLKDFVLSIIIE